MLFSFLEMYGFEEVEVVLLLLLLLKSLRRHFVLGLQVNAFSCQNGILPPLFIGFDSNTLFNNLLLSSFVYEATPFLLSIGHVHLHILFNIPDIVFLSYIFCAS